MRKTLLTFLENVVVIVAVGVSVHYLAGLDWPWAILIGGGVSIALRWLLRQRNGRAREEAEDQAITTA